MDCSVALILTQLPVLQVGDTERGLVECDTDEEEDFTSGDEGSDSEPMIDSLRGNSGRRKSGVKSKFSNFQIINSSNICLFTLNYAAPLCQLLRFVCWIKSYEHTPVYLADPPKHRFKTQ